MDILLVNANKMIQTQQQQQLQQQLQQAQQAQKYKLERQKQRIQRLQQIISSSATASANNTGSRPRPIPRPIPEQRQVKKGENSYHYKLLNKLSSGTTDIDPTTFPPTTFSGSQILNLYAIPKIPVTSRRQVRIAVVIAYHCPTLISDLNTYWKSAINFGPTSSPPSVRVYTFPGARVNNDWSVEESLDLQMVATVNPNALIYVVEARSDSNTDLNAAIQYATNTFNADVISCSWGGDDTSTLISSNTLFTNPSNPAYSKCFCASSGDSNSVCWPAVLSNVMAVGGSTLVWNPTPTNPSARTEYTWTTAGSGYSTSVARPSYQNAVHNKPYRAIPDISLVANPNTGVYVVCNGKWYAVGGTSLSCPIFAGILSIANQQRFNANMNPLTTVYTNTPTSNTQPPPSGVPKKHVQSILYQSIYSTPSLRQSCLTDITIGANGQYSAGNGYDIATGLGSPNVTQLCNALSSVAFS